MRTALRITFALLAASGAILAVAPVGAQVQRYQQPMARASVCDGVEQDRQACLREMGAARQAERNGNLTSAAQPVYTQNALARCSLQPTGLTRRMRGTRDGHRQDHRRWQRDGWRPHSRDDHADPAGATRSARSGARALSLRTKVLLVTRLS